MANKELKSITFEGLDNTYTLLTEEEVNTKLSEYAKTSELNKKLDKGNFSITENNITSPANGKIVAQQTTRLLILSGSNSGNTDDFLDLSKYDSSGIYPESISTWGQEYTNEQLRAMFQTAEVDFIPAPYNDWEFVSLTENTDNLVGQYRRAGNTSEVANLTYYLSNASSENANKFKSDYAYLTFDFYSTDVELSERKIWDIVNPDLAVSASSTNAVSGKAVFNALANKADQSAFGNFTFDTDTLKNDNASAEVVLGNTNTIGMPDNITISQKGINRIDVVHDNAGSWSILDGKVQAFSSDANPVMKEASLFDIINSSEKTAVISDNYGAVIKSDKLGLVNTFMGEAATLTITNLEVLSNGETKSETLENIIDAPSKIANKQDTLISGTNIKTINGESVLGSGNISITTPIDDTLSNTSTNAVQNKVVNAAIDGKVDKTTTPNQVYGTNSEGNQRLYTATGGSPAAWSIPLRNGKGAIVAANATTDNELTTKNYVDTGLVNNIYEANLKWGGKNLTNNFGPLDAALISNLGADRFRGIRLTDGIVIEYSRDGGITWIDYELSSDSKKQIFSDVVPADSIRVGKSTTTTEPTADYKLRVTIDCNAVKVYTQIKKFAINVSTDGSTDCTCTIQSSHINDDTNYDITHAENIPISGWPGWNIINIPGMYLFGSRNTASYYRKNIRFIFSIGGHKSSSIGLQLLNIKAFGGMGWAAPSREAMYGKPFQYDGTKYNVDRLFNFVAGAQINNKEISTKEYVNSKTVTVIDNLTSTSTTAALSANQGKILKLAIDNKASSADLTPIEESINTIKNDYDIISSSTWTYAGSNSGDNGEPNGENCHYISYVCPINPQAIESAKIINPSTGAIVATCTGESALIRTNGTVYHFGDNYNIVIVRPQDANIFSLQSGNVPNNPWSEELYEGVFLTGPLNETSNFWYTGGINTGGLQSVKVDFGNTPLYVRKPLVKTQYVAADSLTQYKYITHLDTGIKECEILACVENVTINSPWGSLYEGTLGSYSFKSGFFTSEPEIHLEMLNTITNDESGGVACFIETGIKPTTTSTGTLYAVRPNSGSTAKKIYFKIYAKEV